MGLKGLVKVMLWLSAFDLREHLSGGMGVWWGRAGAGGIGAENFPNLNQFITIFIVAGWISKISFCSSVF